MTAQREHGLTDERYRGRVTVLFVARLSKRTRIFRAKDVVHPLIAMLRDAMREHGCTCPSFCFLGSELRIVFTGASDDAAPRQAFTQFWDESGKWLAQNRLPGWDPSFFTRPLGKKEERQRAIAEVFGLPMARGLSAKMTTYPFVGSLDPAEDARLEA